MTAQNRKKNSILIFDTNIFLIGIDFNIIPGKIYTIPEIIEEVDVQKYAFKNRNILHRINYAIRSGKLVIRSPKKKSLELVKEASIKTGDFKVLSEADRRLIALTLELANLSSEDVILYTNDYSIQNCCEELNLKAKSILKKGINQQIDFEVYCPQCNSLHDAVELNDKCEICGSRLKRRPKEF